VGCVDLAPQPAIGVRELCPTAVKAERPGALSLVVLQRDHYVVPAIEKHPAIVCTHVSYCTHIHTYIHTYTHAVDTCLEASFLTGDLINLQFFEGGIKRIPTKAIAGLPSKRGMVWTIPLHRSTE